MIWASCPCTARTCSESSACLCRRSACMAPCLLDSCCCISLISSNFAMKGSWWLALGVTMLGRPLWPLFRRQAFGSLDGESFSSALGDLTSSMETVFSEGLLGLPGSLSRSLGSSLGACGSSLPCSGGTSTCTCLLRAPRVGIDFMVRSLLKGIGLPPNVHWCIRRSIRSNRCLTYSRKSTMSMTLALFPPRRRSTTSKNS
mmetsp:Transcript_44867/g.92765  ORF Transcript_44867/g.92765 Transcript_44867/m.92765 type:complete len:201 (-) Transcript_44867:898-1500(-)